MTLSVCVPLIFFAEGGVDGCITDLKPDHWRGDERPLEPMPDSVVRDAEAPDAAASDTGGMVADGPSTIKCA